VIEPLLTAADVAELLAVPESWVREATRQDRLPHIHLGRYIRYHATTIDQWLSDQEHPADPRPIRTRRRA
jgi:excisionase family DNA binding protein